MKPPKPTKADPTAEGYFCGARKKKGGTCEKTAGWGTSHQGQGRCKLHGGASPKAEVAGQVFLARREAAVMGVPLNIEPHMAILECIRIAAGEVAYASERIAELQPGEAVGPVVSRVDRPLKEEKGAESIEYRAEEVHEAGPALHIWIQARHQAMDRLVAYSTAALKAGIEDRQVKLAESQGQLLVTAIKGILEDLSKAVGIALLSHPEAPAIIRGQLTRVAGQGQLQAAA